jgi:sugar lactone lactonase YvrE
VTVPRIEPQRWRPPRAPVMEGRWAPTAPLSGLEFWPVPGQGPEDVFVAADGQVYTGLRDGRVLAVTAEDSREVGRVDSAVLGIEGLPDGRLLLCAADIGLVALDPASGGTEVLLDRVEDRPLVLTNNAVVLSTGVVLFSESSARFPLKHYRADLLEHSATGSLWRFDPADGSVRRLHTGMAFPNGVAVPHDERFVVVAETGAYRLVRIWLSEDRAGQVEEYCSNMPGMPDNLSTGSDGTIWCAVPVLRIPSLDRLLPRHPALRKLVHRLPESLQPSPDDVGLVLGFDESGRVTDNLRSEVPEYVWITGVREHEGWLYLSSLEGQALARHRLTRRPPTPPAV